MKTKLNKDHKSNQQDPTAVRPQLPRDGSKDHKQWTPGTMPKGGFTAVWDFSDNRSNKLSPTTKPQKGKL